MPLVRFELRDNYSLGAVDLYKDVNKGEPKEIMEGVAVAGIVGILRQLGDLVDFAAEVLHGLQVDVAVISSRSHKLMARVRQIEAAVSPLENAIMAQRSHLHFAYTAGFSWQTRVRRQENNFTCIEVPQFIMDSYEGCHSPPRLELLDRFDPRGPGSCLKRYSDPTSLKRESAVPGQVQLEKKRSSWPMCGGESPDQDASFSYRSDRIGLITPSQATSAYEASQTSNSTEQSISYSGNGSDCIESGPSYSTQPINHMSNYVHEGFDLTIFRDSNITGQVSSSNYGDGRGVVTTIDEAKTSPESKEHASKSSSRSSFTFWTNGDEDVRNPDREAYLRTIDTWTEYQKNGASFRKLSCTIPPIDLDIKFGNGLMIGADGETSCHQKTQTYEAKSQRTGQYEVFSGRNTNSFGGESPPLRCMKISFGTIDGFESSELKLNFSDGNTNNGGGAKDLFPSFHLVPETDDDSFCRSSPSVSHGHHSFRSESNSEQWDCNDSTSGKEQELHDALDMISLSGKASSIPKHMKATTLLEESPSVEKAREDALCHSFEEELTNCSRSMDGVKLQLESALPPMPPIQWRNSKSNQDVTENKSTKMPEGFKYTPDHDHASASGAKISQQPKPAPFKESDGRQEVNQAMRTDVKDEFLHQIRTKAFNLRPTTTRKPAPISYGPNNIQVTEILRKAYAIRRAVGSDGGEDSYWSDS